MPTVLYIYIYIIVSFFSHAINGFTGFLFVCFFSTRGMAPGRQCRLKIIVFFVNFLFLTYIVIPIVLIGYHSIIHFHPTTCMYRFARLVVFLRTAAQVQETLQKSTFATSGTEQIETKETTVFIGGNGRFGW